MSAHCAHPPSLACLLRHTLTAALVAADANDDDDDGDDDDDEGDCFERPAALLLLPPLLRVFFSLLFYEMAITEDGCMILSLKGKVIQLISWMIYTLLAVHSLYGGGSHARKGLAAAAAAAVVLSMQGTASHARYE